jgi:hypothetical protein
MGSDCRRGFIGRGIKGERVAGCRLGKGKVFGLPYGLVMTATAVLEEIKHLSPGEQSKVIQFAVELARTRKLAGKELTDLAQRMVESEDPAEVEKLKSALASGFYGN